MAGWWRAGLCKVEVEPFLTAVSTIHAPRKPRLGGRAPQDRGFPRTDTAHRPTAQSTATHRAIETSISKLHLSVKP